MRRRLASGELFPQDHGGRPARDLQLRNPSTHGRSAAFVCVGGDARAREWVDGTVVGQAVVPVSPAPGKSYRLRKRDGRNLTAQVRNLRSYDCCRPRRFVAKITENVKGEILELKDNINDDG